MMLTIREDTAEHPAVSQVIPSILRSLTKSEKQGFAKSFMKSIEVVERLSPSGLYIDTAPAYDVDLSRLDRVAARVIKGLFYHERQFRLSGDYHSAAYSESGFARADNETKRTLQNYAAILRSTPPKTIGNDVFSYWFRTFEEDKYLSIWLLLFYGKIAFLGLTLPEKL